MYNYEEIYQTIEKIAKFALMKTAPIFLGHLFLGIAFGLLLQKSGLDVLWAFLINTLVCAGPVQSALVGIPTDGLSYVTTAVMILLINSRHAFYGLTFIERFKEMRKIYPYVVFSLTDETHSLLCSMARPPDFIDRKWKAATSSASFFDQCHWITGPVLSALMGEPVIFDTTGVDFTMTTLSVVTYVNQRKAARTYIPAITGFICGALFLVPIRSSNFILPALVTVIAILLSLRKTVKRKVKRDQAMAQSNYVLTTISVCVLCAQVTRQPSLLPFGGRREIPGLVRYLGTILLATIMAVLVAYYLKGIASLAYPYGLSELISAAVAVGLHFWKGNTLASIALGTLCYMMLVQLVF